jgi:hypothetical protein
MRHFIHSCNALQKSTHPKPREPSSFLHVLITLEDGLKACPMVCAHQGEAPSPKFERPNFNLGKSHDNLALNPWRRTV